MKKPKKSSRMKNRSQYLKKIGNASQLTLRRSSSCQKLHLQSKTTLRQTTRDSPEVQKGQLSLHLILFNLNELD